MEVERSDNKHINTLQLPASAFCIFVIQGKLLITWWCLTGQVLSKCWFSTFLYSWPYRVQVKKQTDSFSVWLMPFLKPGKWKSLSSSWTIDRIGMSWLHCLMFLWVPFFQVWEWIILLYFTLGFALTKRMLWDKRLWNYKCYFKKKKKNYCRLLVLTYSTFYWILPIKVFKKSCEM